MANGGWAQKVLHHFNYNGRDGTYPSAGLILDTSGNLYGTTEMGGPNDSGTAFELSPAAGGSWTEKILHTFAYPDGVNPWAGLIADASGSLYGTTFYGGIHNFGTVFELTATAGGNWTEKILHNFNYNGTDGAQTYSGLSLDGHGNLYGTTITGGAYSYGTVFELTPSAGGRWAEKIQHNFNFDGEDGIEPDASVTVDAAGNLYGTTLYGGTSDYGTVFELTPTAGGLWTEKILHTFSGSDGLQPAAGVVLDAAGNVYGTTNLGGIFGINAYGYGTVFEITP